MMNGHVVDRYLEWEEGRPVVRETVEAHLRVCAVCARYYREMDRFMDPGLLRDVGALDPDPDLPRRIEALSRIRQGAESAARPGPFALVVEGVAFAGAVVLGVLLGSAFYQGAESGDVDDIVTLYREVIQQDEEGPLLEAVLEPTDGRKE